MAVPSRDSSATCLCLSLRNGKRNLWALPGGNLSLFWRCWDGLLGGRHIVPIENGVFQTPKCCSGGCLADFCPVQGPGGFAGVAATSRCCGRAGGRSLLGWHLRVCYRGRAGVKSTMGKCPLDF